MAILYAKSRGVLIVAAAGNSGGDVGYPGAYPETIAVSALCPKGSTNALLCPSPGGLASFSSRGKQVDFIAPGVDVKSTLPGGSYGYFSGTSMACPHVTGLAALAIGQGHSPLKVRRALMAAATFLPGMDVKEQGAGLIDAGNIIP